MKRLFALVVAGFALFTSAAPAQAAPLYTITNTNGLGLGNPPFTLGFQFALDTPMNVTALGVFDGNQNGLTDSYPIGLWDSGGNLLASATVPNGTGGALVNQFRYISINPVSLLPGTYQIGALFLTGNDGLLGPGGFGTPTGFATDPTVTFVGPRFAFGGTLANPTSPGGGATDFGYFGPNALISPVPEPATFAALGLMGVAGFGYVRRRMKGVPVA